MDRGAWWVRVHELQSRTWPIDWAHTFANILYSFASLILPCHPETLNILPTHTWATACCWTITHSHGEMPLPIPSVQSRKFRCHLPSGLGYTRESSQSYKQARMRTWIQVEITYVSSDLFQQARQTIQMTDVPWTWVDTVSITCLLWSGVSCLSSSCEEDHRAPGPQRCGRMPFIFFIGV